MPLVPGAVQQEVPIAPAELPPRGVEVDPVRLGHRLQQPRWYIDAALVNGSSAPSEIERVGSGTMSSGSITRWNPSPWQRSQHRAAS